MQRYDPGFRIPLQAKYTVAGNVRSLEQGFDKSDVLPQVFKLLPN